MKKTEFKLAESKIGVQKINNKNKNNETKISYSYRTTIPKEVMKIIDLNNGDILEWSYNFKSEKIILDVKTKNDKTTEKTSVNTDETSQKQIKKQNYKKYIKGNKKQGYYIINKEKQINIGTYIKKDDIKSDVDNLINNNWDDESVEISKLNVEYYITEETFPHIRNNKFLYCLTEADYNKMKEDVLNETPFKNISYEDLQKIIYDSIHYEDLPDDTKENKIISTTTTKNNKYQIILQNNPYKQIAVKNIERNKQITTLGASKRDKTEIEKIINEVKKCSDEDEIINTLKKFR